MFANIKDPSGSFGARGLIDGEPSIICNDLSLVKTNLSLRPR